MALLFDLVLVFVAGLVTALATGLGAIPFFVVDDVSDRWTVALWGLASGIMVSASLFGLINEGLAAVDGTPWQLVAGLAAGVVLVVVANRVLSVVSVGDHGHDEAADGGYVEHDDTVGDTHGHGETRDHDDTHGHDDHIDAEAIAEGDLKKMILILGVLTVHSFPEGVAIGVSFAELGFGGGVPFLGLSIPLLAVFMTLAISIQNVPEGLAVSIPLQDLDVSRWRMVGAAVFSSLPQPIGAVIAFGFVRWAQQFLPFGFGFAAGAMIYLVATELVPEGLEAGAQLPKKGYRELVGGLAVGVAVMAPLAAF